jgi:hypothetical protein
MHDLIEIESLSVLICLDLPWSAAHEMNRVWAGMQSLRDTSQNRKRIFGAEANDHIYEGFLLSWFMTFSIPP